MSDEFDSQRLRPATLPRRAGAKQSNGKGSKSSRSGVANFDHHRLYREIEQLRRHGREVLARTREMMSLLAKTLKRAQGSVDEQKKHRPGGAEIGKDPGQRPAKRA